MYGKRDNWISSSLLKLSASCDKLKYLYVLSSKPLTVLLFVSSVHSMELSEPTLGSFPITSLSGIKKLRFTAKILSSFTSTTTKLPSAYSSSVISPESLLKQDDKRFYWKLNAQIYPPMLTTYDTKAFCCCVVRISRFPLAQQRLGKLWLYKP